MRAGATAAPARMSELLRAGACAVLACALWSESGIAPAQDAPKAATQAAPKANSKAVPKAVPKAAPQTAPLAAGKTSGQLAVKRLFVSGSAGGIAEIRTPADWLPSGRSTPIDLRLTRPGSRDHLRITALPVPKERMGLMTDEKLQEMLRERGNQLLAVSVEKSLDIKPLAGVSATGWYYALSDKRRVDAPDSDTDFRFMHSGMIRMGGWMAVFTIFTNSRDGVFAREALAAMATLRWREAEPKRAVPDLFNAARLGASPVPELQAKEELLCQSKPPRVLFENFDAGYAGLLGTRVRRTAFESFDDGAGDAGSVLYMEFAVPLAPETTSFVAGLLWGAEFPSRQHQEEFYAAGNQMIIWCTKAESRIKRLSQAKLEALLFGAK